jgi:hypothetical protein
MKQLEFEFMRDLRTPSEIVMEEMSTDSFREEDRLFMEQICKMKL